MPIMLAQQRKARLIDAMAEAGLDVLLVYGNGWQNDYLRYATDFGILEGQALALVRHDGQVTLYLDSPLEADRAQIDCPGVEVIHAPDLVGEVDGVNAADIAVRIGLTLGRVSQLRREFEKSWSAFHGEEAESERMELLVAT